MSKRSPGVWVGREGGGKGRGRNPSFRLRSPFSLPPNPNSSRTRSSWCTPSSRERGELRAGKGGSHAPGAPWLSQPRQPLSLAPSPCLWPTELTLGLVSLGRDLSELHTGACSLLIPQCPAQNKCSRRVAEVSWGRLLGAQT